MTEILITGAAGFIGYHTAKYLAADKNNKIILVDNLARGRMDDELKELIDRKNVIFQEIDLCDNESVESINRKFDYVYHFAAKVGVKHCENDPAAVLKVNTLSVNNIAGLARRNQWKNLFFSSTSEVYAGSYEFGILPVPTAEKVPLCIADITNPRFSYAVSKMYGEQLLMFSLRDTGTKYVIGRYHNIYGPRMGYAHVIPEVIKRIKNKENPFKIYGYDQSRAFCYITDAVRATVGLLEKNTNNGIFHIGNDREEINIEKLIIKLLKISGYNPEIEKVSAPPGSVKRRCPKIDKLTKSTGYVPDINLNKGLDLTYAWYIDDLKNNPVWE